jgi:hypothetical protein
VRAGRQREEIGAFEILWILVVKLLINGCGRQEFIHTHRDTVIRHFKRRKGKVSPNHRRRRILDNDESIPRTKICRQENSKNDA